MVVFTRNQDKQTQRFVIRPNSSLTWSQVIAFFLVIAITTLSVAVFFTLQGFWVILPFAGVEVILVGWALYMTARRCTLKEVIRIGVNTLYIERGRYTIEQKYEFMTAWTKVSLNPSKFRNHPSKLMIG